MPQRGHAAVMPTSAPKVPSRAGGSSTHSTISDGAKIKAQWKQPASSLLARSSVCLVQKRQMDSRSATVRLIERSRGLMVSRCEHGR
jgi:hypothetical protein